MNISQATLRYMEDDSLGEAEVYKIVETESNPEKGLINSKTELARRLQNSKVGETIELSTGAKYYVVDLVEELDLFTLVKMCKQACLEKRDQDAVELSWKLTEFLSETAGIPEEVNKIKDKAVSAHLNLGELDKAV